MSAAVAILARAPIAGCAKTRLTPPLTPEHAARVARACIEETLLRFPAALPFPFTLFLDGAPDQALRDLARSVGVGLAPQDEGDLGARIAAAFRRLRTRGADTVIAIGADSPTMDPRRIADAVRALEASDVVLAPAVDGGYVLVGARGDRDAIFEGIPWSTGRTLEATLGRAHMLGYATSILPAHYDIDDAASLRRAVRDGFGSRGDLADVLRALGG